MSTNHPNRGSAVEPPRPSARLLYLMPLFAVLLTIACQPKDTRPGAWLRGSAAEEPVADWGFTDGIEEIFIQTRTWYGIPHSTTIWCGSMDGDLYVGSYGEEKKRWERNIARNPAARLGIDGALYDVRLTEVTDEDLVG